jgi:hypothetical protein
MYRVSRHDVYERRARLVVWRPTSRSSGRSKARRRSRRSAARGIARDFNNLLIVIPGYSKTMLAALRPSHPLAHDVIEIRRAADRAALLTRQLRAFSRRQFLRPTRLWGRVDDTYDIRRRLSAFVGSTDCRLVTGTTYLPGVRSSAPRCRLGDRIHRKSSHHRVSTADSQAAPALRVANRRSAQGTVFGSWQCSRTLPSTARLRNACRANRRAGRGRRPRINRIN